MPLESFAAEKGVQPEQPMSMGRWFEEHPDLRDEVIHGWKKGYPIGVIADYLRDEHECPFGAASVRGWLVVVAGARGH
jgi:hypothetical protein